MAHRPDGSLLACLCNRLGLLPVLPGRAGLRAEAAATVLPFPAHHSPPLPLHLPFVGCTAGIGVCAALALLELPSSQALPPLECLFTVDEETGLTGV